MPFSIDVESFRHWVHDVSYWEMNASLRVCADDSCVFKSTAAPIIYVVKEIRNLMYFVFH